METVTKSQFQEVLEKVIKLQREMESLKKVSNITVVEESLSEIWNNEEDERWNDL